jgi:hypothetical protein
VTRGLFTTPPGFVAQIGLKPSYLFHPDDHIDPRRSALFMARSALEDIRKEKRDARSTAWPSDDNTEDLSGHSNLRRSGLDGE